MIADVFVKIGQFLKLYAHYIKDYEARCTYLEDARKKYPEFNQIVQQFEVSCPKKRSRPFEVSPVSEIVARNCASLFLFVDGALQNWIL